MSESIHQEIVFNASADSVYNALTNSNEFSQMTGGAPAEISSEAGGSFSLFGGKIVGRNVELKANERIVQAWRAADWDEGVYSIIKIELQENGGETKLVFDQSGYPIEFGEHLEGGWHEMYWKLIKAHVN